MYDIFYTFNSDPFRLSPDHRFCYNHKGYAKARAYMAYAFRRAEGFVMITGRPGTGKTTLIGELIESLEGSQVHMANLVCSQLEAEDLLKMVAYEFGIESPAPKKGELLQQLSVVLRQWHKSGGRALLIVDEAQDLSLSAMEELRLLTNIQEGGAPLLQIFLLGQSELRDLILSPAMEQVHQRIVAASHLESLPLDDTEAYILHRLRKVGWRGDPLLSQALFPLIHQFSDGVPRRINLICSRLLLHGAVEEKHRLGVKDLEVVIAELQGENLAVGDNSEGWVFAVEDVFEEPSLIETSAPSEAGESSPEQAREGPAQEPEVQGSLAASDSTDPAGSAAPIAESAPVPGATINPDMQPAAGKPGAPTPAGRVAGEGSQAGNGARRWMFSILLLILVAGLGWFFYNSDSTTALVRTMADLLSTSPVQNTQPNYFDESLGEPASDTPEGAEPSTRSVDKRTASGPEITPPEEAIESEAAVREREPMRSPREAPLPDSSSRPAPPASSLGESQGVKSSEKGLAGAPPVASTVRDDRLAQLEPRLIEFAFNSTLLSERAQRVLDEVVLELARSSTSRVSLTGYSDSQGDEDYNMDLSRRRAGVAAGYLADQGIDRNRLAVYGRGTEALAAEGVVLSGARLSGRVVQITIIPKGL